MNSMEAVMRGIDAFSERFGRLVSWLTLGTVLVCFTVVVLRYLLGIGSIWLQESIIYSHAAMFLLVAAWTLKNDGHVRVDVLYASASSHTKAIVDLCGALLLLIPFATAILYFSLPYVARSWSILEGSREASGLPLIFALKTLIPIFAVMLILQGAAQAMRAWSVLSGKAAA